MIEINKEMNGREVEVALGELFEVRLSENPTTGYRWQLCSSGAPVVEVQEDSFQRSGGQVGAGGVHYWRFRAVQEGSANVEMEYRREWEQRAAETLKVTVHVRLH